VTGKLASVSNWLILLAVKSELEDKVVVVVHEEEVNGGGRGDDIIELTVTVSTSLSIKFGKLAVEVAAVVVVAVGDLRLKCDSS